MKANAKKKLRTKKEEIREKNKTGKDLGDLPRSAVCLCAFQHILLCLIISNCLCSVIAD